MLVRRNDSFNIYLTFSSLCLHVLVIFLNVDLLLGLSTVKRWFIEASFDGFIIEIKVAAAAAVVVVLAFAMNCVLVSYFRAEVNVLSGKSGFTLLDKPRVKEIGVHVT